MRTICGRAIAGAVAGAFLGTWVYRWIVKQMAPKHDRTSPQTICELRNAVAESQSTTVHETSNNRRSRAHLGIARLIVFAFFTGLAVWQAIALYPARDDLSNMASSYEFEVPSVYIPEEQLPEWFKSSEYHAEDADFGEYDGKPIRGSVFGPMSILLSEYHDPSSGDTTVRFHAMYSATVPDKMLARVSMKYPPDAQVVSCTSQAAADVRPTVDLKCDPGSDRRSGELTIYTVFQTADQSYLDVTIVLRNTPGVGFKQTNTRTQVRFPTISWYFPVGDCCPACCHPLAGYPVPDQAQMDVHYAIREASRITFPEPIPKFEQISTLTEDNELVDGAIWKVPVDHTQSSIIGVREDVLDKISRNTFLAGAWLGIAGGAGIAAIDALFGMKSDKQ